MPAPAILDSDGKDIGPADLQWQLEHRDGSWWLALEVDDRALPLPYVIDPAITYRASTTANNGGGANTLAIARPAGTVANDVLLAKVTFYGNTITPPAGWTLIRRTDVMTAAGQAVYYRVAAGAAPASYTWNFGSSQPAGGGIAASGAWT